MKITTWKYVNANCIEIWEDKINPNDVGIDSAYYEFDVDLFFEAIKVDKSKLSAGDWGVVTYEKGNQVSSEIYR